MRGAREMEKAASVVPGWLGILLLVLGAGCRAEPTVQDRPASDLELVDPAGSYEKREYRIEVRDGVELYTAVYLPRDTTREYPILLRRTPYNCGPYGTDGYPRRIGPSRVMEEEGYIFACQDVRGRYMSEGQYDNMRPHVPGDSTIDESSDTYDTIDWLLANVPRNNGKVGMWGISYPGFYAAAALPEAHPALVASSPQAPIADFFFDDFHHHGAYLLSYWLITPVFGYQKTEPTSERWFPIQRPATRDGYKFYMGFDRLSDSYGEDNFFWRQMAEVFPINLIRGFLHLLFSCSADYSYFSLSFLINKTTSLLFVRIITSCFIWINFCYLFFTIHCYVDFSSIWCSHNM